MALCQYSNHGNMAYCNITISKIVFRYIKLCDIKLQPSLSVTRKQVIPVLFENLYRLVPISSSLIINAVKSC